MLNVVVLYATREGQTQKVAARLAQHLREYGADVRLMNAKAADSTEDLVLSTFDLLVFGASMHAGGLERELVDYVNRHSQEIAGQRRSFFLLLLSAATRDADLRSRWLADAHDKLCAQLEVAFDDTEFIAGALAYSRYSLALKWVMKRIARQAGEGTDTSRDYEYTDWAQVRRYAERLHAGIAD